MSDEAYSLEERILNAVKRTLTRVIKDTATAPGMKHPLSEETIDDLRNCLALISAREQELADTAGRRMNARPRFKDEPKAQAEVIIPLHQSGLIGKKYSREH